MWKKSVCGLTILVAGLLVWSCGDGSVDSLSDNELMMISRFPSTIDYDMLDSVVNACKNDAVCWEKAKKTGEIYKGDYTKVLRDSSGNIVVVEGDSAYIWKDGKKLPVFDFSSNSAGDEDDVTSGSTSMSASSTGRSSSSVSIEDDVNNGGSQGSENGSSGGTSSRAHAEESSSGKSAISSSSIDASQYTNASSSSLGVYSGSTSSNSRSSSSVASSSSKNLDFMTSSSIPMVSMSSVANGDVSSSSKNALSAGSESSHGGGSWKCGETPIVGTCKTNRDEVFKGDDVVYTYTPSSGSCTDESAILWVAGDDDASVSTQKGGFSFTVQFSKVGSKSLTFFTMDNTRIPCGDVLVRTNCNTPNTYSCTGGRTSTYENIWKNSPREVSFTWTVAQTAGCFDTLSTTWGGAFAGEQGLTVTKTYTSPVNQPVTMTIVDENTTTNLVCGTAYATYVEEKKPTCSVKDTVAFAGDDIVITPYSVVGCNYNNEQCSYALTTNDGSPVVDDVLYGGGPLKPFEGESTNSTVNYKLTLHNYLGDGVSCPFKVQYVVADSRTATTVFENYDAGGVYKVSVGAVSNHKFRCKAASLGQTRTHVGTFDGIDFDACDENYWCGTGADVLPNSAHLFVVADDAPAGLSCGLLNW